MNYRMLGLFLIVMVPPIFIANCGSSPDLDITTPTATAFLPLPTPHQPPCMLGEQLICFRATPTPVDLCPTPSPTPTACRHHHEAGDPDGTECCRHSDDCCASSKIWTQQEQDYNLAHPDQEEAH